MPESKSPPLASKLLHEVERDTMDTLVIGGTFLGTLVGAFMLQKYALEGVLRVLSTERRVRR
jgi:hypothetical protein